MGFYLNNSEPYSMYQEMVRNPYFVDKTQMIEARAAEVFR